MRFESHFLATRAMATLVILLGGGLVHPQQVFGQATEPVSYVRDVRPILAAKCWHCHGPDAGARKADLRLDGVGAEALTKLVDGRAIIAPGKPQQSELVRRITASDADERMPPADQPRQLTPAEIGILQRWIEQGGEFARHWSFTAPERPGRPANRDPNWARNAIDDFVLQRLEREGIHHSPEADKSTLIRRLTLDLTGLPPSPQEVADFLADTSPAAYDRLVDRLLASPRFGERMGLMWLDAARYADSGGYQGDILRSMWIWRDWAIAAFNRDLPFDQFTIEQIAGDLLSGATLEQRIATGFHRNHRINDEDGIIVEEYRVEYVADRAETTATVWLGLTVGCARCHDHKYDPISQREYYQLFAYFNSINEQGRGHGNAPPLLQLPSPELEKKIAAADADIATVQQQQAALGAEDEANKARHAEVKKKLEDLRKSRDALARSIPTTMVLQELEKPRDTFVLVRGAYDKPGDKVGVATPASLAPAGSEFPPNRLGLARWLVDQRHPLTSRVTVNRIWQMLFARGLVETSEDFGVQGQLPTHPELLDWLACEFSGNWDLKQLVRLIVSSATYRQSSRGTAEQFARDPTNRWYGRGSRYRLAAELLRDGALFASGLLVERIGGPSVRPYQPEGLWKELASADLDYQQGHGADLYRRGMYTFIRRTVPPPGMAALDAPNREICTVRRARTNTPIQALVVMNDVAFVEAARHLAARILHEAGPETNSQLEYLFQVVLARKPTAAELSTLAPTVQYYRQRFAANPDGARKLIATGESPVDTRLAAEELAAWTATASLVLNLDEALTRE